MRIAIHGAALAAALALGGAAAGCVSASKAGSVGEDCYPNASCNVGLTCQAGKCVAGSGTLTGGSGGQNTGGATAGTGGHGGAGGQTATTSTTSAGTGGTSGTTTSSTATGTSSGSTGTSAGAGPIILVLGSNVPSITQGEAVTVSAVVTDPDGIDDVIGGILSDANGGIYGAFATTGQEGAYEMVVSWGQIQQVGSIDFAQGATGQRTFTAEFFDQAGHTVQKTITVTLGCKGLGACAGACLDLSQDSSNCGTCGHTCPAGGCYKSQCAAFSNCLGHATSCIAGCTAIGKACSDKCNGAGGVSFSAASCGGTPTQVACSTTLGATTSAACCCF